MAACARMVSPAAARRRRGWGLEPLLELLERSRHEIVGSVGADEQHAEDRQASLHLLDMLWCVRTTIRLPDELYRQVRVRAATEGVTLTSFIEDALRDAFARHQQSAAVEPYRVKPFEGNGLQPGVDLDDNAALLGLMESDDRP